MDRNERAAVARGDLCAREFMEHHLAYDLVKKLKGSANIQFLIKDECINEITKIHVLKQ